MDVDRMIDILQAYKEGKTIQVNFYKEDDKWTDTDNLSQLSIHTAKFFRIKPKYRPFVSNFECALGLTYHSYPGSLLQPDYKNTEYNIIQFNTDQSDESWDIEVYNQKITFEEAFEKYTFVDGTPFGVTYED